MGLRGVNNADLSSATDGGYIDYNGIINFNAWTASGQNGDFQTNNGYTDSVFPFVMTGAAPAPITIPTIVVNGYNGERDTWSTNTDLTATIGASQNQNWGSADYGKGMGRIDMPVIIPAAGAHPIHLTYFQGNGGAGMEWQTYQGYDGVVLGSTNMVVINDTSNPSSLVAYRGVKALPTPTLRVSKQGTSWIITYTGVLKSCATVNAISRCPTPPPRTTSRPAPAQRCSIGPIRTKAVCSSLIQRDRVGNPVSSFCTPDMTQCWWGSTEPYSGSPTGCQQWDAAKRPEGPTSAEGVVRGETL